MTTEPPLKTPHALAGRPQASAGPTAPGANIDVVKILKKYLWVLLGSVIVGGVVGVGAHLLLLRIYPVYEPKAVFQVLPPTLDPGEAVFGTDEDEQARFAATEVAQMKSDDVIQSVVTDPRLAQNGGAWYQKFVGSGGGFQTDDAAEWLLDYLKVRQIPNTDIIEMSVGWKDRNSITNVLGFVRETYMNLLTERTRNQTSPQREALEQIVNQLEETYRDKQTLRDQILRTDEVDSLEQRYAADSFELNGVLTTLHGIRTAIEGAKTQLSTYQAELNAPGGPTYSDELISAVEAEPLIQNTMQTIASLEAQKQALQHQVGPDHRAMKSVDSLIDSWRSKLQEQRNDALRKRFAAIIDGLNNTISQYTAQATDLTNQQQRLVNRLIDLSKTMVKVDDLDHEIAQVLDTKSDIEKQLASLDSVSRLSTARRIIVVQQERIPDKPVFPDILVMGPAGVVLCVGLTLTLVFLRELFDQRVKGPADIALIPRTRVLGFVPDASEDSNTPADQVARALTKAPRGVLAESYRQIRAPLLKQMDIAGHKSIVVLAGMPGSGASTTVSNLAAAAAASGKKTLIIDANFRRPAQHKYFGLADAPGLSDILAGQSSLEAAVAPTDAENLSLLPAGTAASRVVERLAGSQFGELLARAGAGFDAIFIDVPPVIVAGDGLSIANRCDASVLVTKAYAEKRGLVARLRNELGETRAEFLGVVINGVKAAAGGYLRGNIRASQDYAGSAN